MPLRLLLAALCACAALPALAVASDVGVVKISKGAAAIERGGRPQPAPPGTKVREGDVVVTGKDGAVGVTFSDNSLLSIGPDSRLAIDRFAFDPRTHRGAFESSLERGTLAGVSGKIAKQSPDAMKVRTPAALLGVRGTEFLLRTGAPGR
ncbi:MAG: FecR domain-containing protein [Candidatus Rokubacteria bacterium]|nr:FecR domain-containing protein [Candidatus Rokubacteria bacterium]